MPTPSVEAADDKLLKVGFAFFSKRLYNVLLPTFAFFANIVLFPHWIEAITLNAANGKLCGGYLFV
jgi:hypothetical protein